jgi:hypothetical protein
MTVKAQLVEVPAAPAPLPHPTHRRTVEPARRARQRRRRAPHRARAAGGRRARRAARRARAAPRGAAGTPGGGAYRHEPPRRRDGAVRHQARAALLARGRASATCSTRTSSGRSRPTPRARSRSAIPDAGSVYLTTKNAGGKARVSDADALEAWLEELTAEELKKLNPAIRQPRARSRSTWSSSTRRPRSSSARAVRHGDASTATSFARTPARFSKCRGIEAMAEERTVAVRLA